MTGLATTRGGAARRPSAGRARPAGTRVRRHTSSHAGVAWTFVAPFLLLFALFTAIPAIAALSLSFTDISSSDLRDPLSVDFVGLDTFVSVLTNGGFLRSVLNTGIFVGVGVPLTLAIAFLLALVLNEGITRLKSLFRAAIYLPVITNIVAAAVIWQYAFTIDGPLNSALAIVGIDGPNWLGDPPWAVTTVLSLGIWRNIGTCMVLFLAGLQAIPEEITEASSLDGAGYWKRQWFMTLPMLRPTTLLVTVLMTVSFMNIFDEPYLVTNGGPLSSTKSIAFWVYEQFGYGNVANSMAGSWVLLTLVAVVSFVQLRILRPKD